MTQAGQAVLDDRGHVPGQGEGHGGRRAFAFLGNEVLDRAHDRKGVLGLGLADLEQGAAPAIEHDPLLVQLEAVGDPGDLAQTHLRAAVRAQHHQVLEGARVLALVGKAHQEVALAGLDSA